MAIKLASEEITYDPVCPHCEKEMNEIHWRRLQAIHAEYLFVCPNCHKVLGVGVR